MDHEFDHIEPAQPAQPINPYQASSTFEAYRSPPISGGNGQPALWLGVISLVSTMLGFLGMLCCFPFVFNIVGLVTGFIAVFLGIKERRALRDGYSHPSNATPSLLGVIFGAIGLAVNALMLLAFVGFIVFAILADANNW